eukprot:325120-Chlamydomonas_euryale.AAC.1
MANIANPKKGNGIKQAWDSKSPMTIAAAIIYVITQARLFSTHPHTHSSSHPGLQSFVTIALPRCGPHLLCGRFVDSLWTRASLGRMLEILWRVGLRATGTRDSSGVPTARCFTDLPVVLTGRGF